MCVKGELLSMLDVMNARWDYRGRRSISVMKIVDGSGQSMKMVDGAMSIGMMSVVKMVISCHSFLHVRYYFAFLLFRFL